jgi:penicillin-binding protein 1A
VVEEGTAKRAMLGDIKAASKAGTTNPYRDAWFVGYTVNFVWGVWGVWYGNDRGSLPAQTWREIIAHAHQGVALIQVAGIRDGRAHYREGRQRARPNPTPDADPEGRADAPAGQADDG